MHAIRNPQLALIAATITLCSCATPTATTDLIAVGKMGLDQAATAERQAHARLMDALDRQKHTLDAAFDADVRLAANRSLQTAAGEPIELSAEWIIAARQGYAAARDEISRQQQAERSAHLQQLDNLQAATEALDLAAELTVLQWNVGEQIKQKFLQLQRSHP